MEVAKDRNVWRKLAEGCAPLGVKKTEEEKECGIQLII